jgi:uncharacterized membrane protein YeaQ/YmgE (transglycosylase-associated protein family)
MINFLAAIGIGLVIGLIGGFWLKGKEPNAIWLAPLLAVVGSVAASTLAWFVGDRADYGYKEPILQVVLAVAGVAVVAFLASRKSASRTGAGAGE